MAKEFGTLPQQGGLLDQDFYIIKLLRAGLHGLAAKSEYDRKHPPRE